MAGLPMQFDGSAITAAKLKGEIGTARTTMTGNITLPVGTYIITIRICGKGGNHPIRIELGTNAVYTIASDIICGIVSANTSHGVYELTGFVKITQQTTFYAYAFANQAYTPDEDQRFSSINAIKIA